MFAGLLRLFISILILLLSLQPSYGTPSPYCDPSSCGNIPNISFPFRLRSDPPHCGDAAYELVCESNTNLSYLESHRKYRVESINYDNYTIHFSDASIDTNNLCSFPQNTLEPDKYPYSLGSLTNNPYSFNHFYSGESIARPAIFLSCQYPLNEPSIVALDSCDERDGISMHKYVKLCYLNASDLEFGNQCRIDLTAMMNISFEENNNISLVQIHSSLLYGFEASWFSGSAVCHEKCRRRTDFCLWNRTARAPICELGSVEIMSSLEAFFYWPNFRIFAPLILGCIIALRFVIGWTIFLAFLVYTFRRRHLSMFDVIEGFLQNPNHLFPIRYSYSDIKKMTSRFRLKLGQGGYGSVYKGKLRSGDHVAVKLLSTKSKSNGQDFINEVATIGRIHHVNIVRLVGYSAERSKCALVYDYMCNGSLDKYILGQETTNMLTWEKKFDIAVGVARGIEYLHKGCDMQILHFDIKPHNILLDERFTPKISDFGLARLYPTEKNTVTLTAARGTIGYVAPELINRSIGNVSYKADVYSFGMLLMEMVGLKRDLVADGDESSQYFPDWIYYHLEKKHNIEAEIDDLDEKLTRKMAIVGLWCIQMSPGERPSMSKVLEMLEGEVESLHIPPRPEYSQPEVVIQTSETDTTDSVALLCEDISTNQILESL